MSGHVANVSFCDQFETPTLLNTSFREQHGILLYARVADDFFCILKKVWPTIRRFKHTISNYSSTWIIDGWFS